MLRSCSIAVAALLLWGHGPVMAQTPAGPPAAKVGQFRISGPLVTAAGPSQADEYYLGIACMPATPALRAQLNLSERQGVLVGGVVPGSPASAVGIAQHDVLTRVGGKAITDPRDVLDAVQASKGGKLKIELIRGGKPKTIEVAPAKRPVGPLANLPGQEEAGGPADQAPVPGDWETVQKWLEGAFGREGEGPRPLTFRVVGPGAIVPKDVLVQKPLPTDLSIVVSRSGDQPAQIKVQRGRQKWELTEKELDKLPADVRPFVEQMLGRGPFGLVGNVRAFGSPQEPGQNVFYQPLPGPGPSDGRIERRLDEMNQRIDKLFQIMEKMAEGQTHHNTLPKGAQK